MKLKSLIFYFLIKSVLISNCFAQRDELLFCKKFKHDIEKAQTKYDAYERFLNILIRNEIIIQPEVPTAKTLNDESGAKPDDYYENPTFLIKLSETVAKTIFKNKLPVGENINGLLAYASECFYTKFSKFCVKSDEYKCNKNIRYRPIDGYCNNPKYPKDGAAGTPYASILYSKYDDSIYKIRKSATHRKTLPSTRILSNTFSDKCLSHDVFLPDAPNMGSIMFGQLVSHDVSFRNTIQRHDIGSRVQCCNSDFSGPHPKRLLHPLCNPIEIPKNDSFFQKYNIRCMNFLRGQDAFDNDCVLSSKKQLNLGTSMLDLSNIYGNSLEESLRLRAMECGKLKTNKNGFFPQDKDGNYFTGDPRFVQSPITSLFQILFLKEHNRICDIIKEYKPNLSDELIYQEARRYVIAEYQHIFLYEWWPIFSNGVGRPKIFDVLDIKIKGTATMIEASSGSLRLLHYLTPQFVELYDEDGNKISQAALSDTFLNPSLLFSNYNDLVRGLFNQKINFNGCSDELRNKLFKNVNGFGFDLMAIDISRGRDFGMQPYYKYAELCLFKIIKDFDDLAPEISDKDIIKLREIYDSVKDIDLYVALELEKASSRHKFGPTANCINAEQFFRYTTKDSFFYENKKNPYPFSKGQLKQIRKASFARLLCDNSNIEMVPRNAFFPPCNDNPKVLCSKIPSVEVVDILDY